LSNIVVLDGEFPTYAGEKRDDLISAAGHSWTVRKKRSTILPPLSIVVLRRLEATVRARRRKRDIGCRTTGRALGQGRTITVMVGNEAGGLGLTRSVTGRAVDSAPQVALPSVSDVQLAPAGPGECQLADNESPLIILI
jgi:hypothetical protein